MRSTSTLFLSLMCVGSAVAQCSSSIPSNAIVLNTSGLVAATAQSFWVCPGANPTFGGDNNTVYIEMGSVSSVTGDGNTVMTKTFLGVSGDNNTIYTTSSGNILDQGNNNNIVVCAAVQFDYNNAPSAGCAVGIEEANASVNVQVLPNPVRDVLTITADGSTVHGVQLIDLLGHPVLYQAGAKQTQMDIGSVPAGVYLVQVFTSKGTVLQRIVKQ